MAFTKWMGFTSPANGSAPHPALSVVPNSPFSSSPEYRQFGLENFGNTCYVNSVLQALYFCHPFRELILHTPDKSNPPVPICTYRAHPASPINSRVKNGRKLSSAELPRPSDASGTSVVSPGAGPPIPASPPSLFSALRAIFLHISDNTNEKGTLSPKAFIDKLKKENEIFRSPTTHQDAHEFLMFLLNKVAEDLDKEPRDSIPESTQREEDTTHDAAPSSLSMSKSSLPSGGWYSTIVHKLFEGVLTSETRCLTCQTVSSRDEEFLDLSIDIEQNTSVTACLKQFSASEMLCQKNKFYCDACHGLQEAEKRMKIKKLPNILTLHLKRFKYQEEKYIKLLYRVAFPLSLRLFNTMDDADNPDRLYELFAVVVHIGTGPNHGHYVTIAKSRNSWVLFDDDAVETIKESDIPKYFGEANNGCAYLLYYQAVDLNQAELGLQPKEVFIPETTTDCSSSQGPALPPGLTHEGDSDASEPLPITPAMSPAIAPSVAGLKSPPPFSIDIPSSPSPHFNASSPAQTPSVASPVSKQGGFFGNIRHYSSRHQLSHQSQPNITAIPVPPVPPVPAIPSSFASPKPASIPIETISQSHERAGETTDPPRSPRKMASGWFSRRRSARADARPSTAHEFRPPQFGADFLLPELPNSSAQPQQLSSSGHGSNSLSTVEPIPLAVPPSPALSSAAAPIKPPSSLDGPSVPSSPCTSTTVRSPTSPPSSYLEHQVSASILVPKHKKLRRPRAEMASADISPPVTPASFGPAPRPDPHATSHIISQSTTQFVSRSTQPTPPPTPQSPSQAGPQTTPQPEPRRKRTSFLRRPETAGGTPSRGSLIRFDNEPSVPAVPPALQTFAARPRIREPRPGSSRAEQERNRLSMQTPPPPPTPARRPARKLSFSSSMLSFGRKDKDRSENIGISPHGTDDTTRSLLHSLSFASRM